MPDDLNDMIQGFVEESHEAFDDIENDLLTIESNPDDLSIVNGIFRVMHTIKGTAGFLNLDEIGKLAHKIESLFDMIRREELKITSEIMDTLLPSIDLLKLMVFELIETKKSDYQLEDTLKALQEISQSQKPFRKSPPEERAEVEMPLPFGKPAQDSVEEIDEEMATFRSSLESISPQLRMDFVVEAEEHLETVEENLLILEQAPDDINSINEIFRAIHSIKGTSDYVNIETITRIAHKLETIFDKIRKSGAKYDDQLADVVLKGTDVLRTLIFMLKTEDYSTDIKICDILDQLDALISVKKDSRLEKEETAASAPSSSFAAFRNISSQQLLVIEHLGSNFLNNSLEPDELTVLSRSLKTLRDGAGNIGIYGIVSLSTQLVKIIAAVTSGKASLEEVSSAFTMTNQKLVNEMNRINGLTEQEFVEMLNETPPDEAAEEQTEKKIVSKPESDDSVGDLVAAQPIIKDNTIKTMRVDSSRLDTFMNLIGELIISRNSYSHTISELTEQRVPSDLLQELKSIEANFNRISEDLQGTLMEIRLLPIKSVFQKIPRIIRDIARKRNKKINFQMIGENTEIDKSIIEMIGDPLVHIVRNCCDHGIESAEERLHSGKPEIGNIVLRASHLGSAIAIDVIDDGAGINTELVKRIAIEKGMITREKAETLEDKTINSFIFQPGFSTATEVTDISGRGVGMDVVITNIKKIHGTVDVESEKGHGTQVRLLLPLTLAVVDALLVLDNNQKYAIPLEAVKETIEIKESELQILKQKEAINLRGDIIGISRLSNLLGVPKRKQAPDEVLSVVFLQAGARLIGIIVDDLSNQQEIVVKPLQKYLSNIPGISGSTILGNGEIILILDPAELIDLTTI